MKETIEHEREGKRTFSEFFLSRTSWVVWLAILLTAAMMVLQKFILSTILPHETMAWGLTVITGGYTGMDRFAMFVKSRTLEYGEADMGDPKKIRWIILCLTALIIEALVLQVFQSVEGLALETLIVAFSACGGSYVIGNRAIRASAFTAPVQASTNTNSVLGGSNESNDDPRGDQSAPTAT